MKMKAKKYAKEDYLVVFDGTLNTVIFSEDFNPKDHVKVEAFYDEDEAFELAERLNKMI